MEHGSTLKACLGDPDRRSSKREFGTISLSQFSLNTPNIPAVVKNSCGTWIQTNLRFSPEFAVKQLRLDFADLVTGYENSSGEPFNLARFVGLNFDVFTLSVLSTKFEACVEGNDELQFNPD